MLTVAFVHLFVHQRGGEFQQREMCRPAGGGFVDVRLPIHENPGTAPIAGKPKRDHPGRRGWRFRDPGVELPCLCEVDQFDRVERLPDVVKSPVNRNVLVPARATPVQLTRRIREHSVGHQPCEQEHRFHRCHRENQPAREHRDA